MSKQVVCIFDSTDNTGKTQISQEVSRITGIPYFKNVEEHDHFLINPDYFRFAAKHVDGYFFAYLQSSGASIILDRAWPSEWVYSKVLGRPTDDNVLDRLDRISASIGTKIVMPYRTTYEHVDDYPTIKERILEIDKCYAEFAKWTRCQTLRLCVDAQDLRGDSLKVIDFLRSS